MKKKYVPTLITLLLLSSCPVLQAQNAPLYSYQDLSNISYKKEKDSIRKSWICPDFSGEKATQYKFKEIWDNRTEFLVKSIEANDYLKDDDIYQYVNQIIIDIAKANPLQIRKLPLLIIDRSSSVNAYSLGNNVLVVNIGLIAFSQSREELALAVAHELSHDVLNHVENAMKERAVLLTSEEYKRSLESVLDSKYERLTKLKKILEGFAFSRNRHNRYHEAEADSLAIIFLKNAGISFNPGFFLRLDSSDTQYKKELLKPVKEYLLASHLSIEDWWFANRTKGLSAKNYNFKDSTGINDSLKTHPDCIERYNKNKQLFTPNGSYSPITKEIQEKANRIIIWNLFNSLDLTACLYRVFLEIDKGYHDPWYHFMTSNVLAGLYYSSLVMKRFNAIDLQPKENISKRYYELQTMLEQIPLNSLEVLNKEMAAQPFWSGMPADAKDLQVLITNINMEGATSDKKKSSAAKYFINTYPTSMYCEFAENFKK